MKTLPNKHRLAWLAPVLVVIIPLVLWSYPNDPPLGKTGAPGEGTCSSCHSGGQGGGSIQITSSAGTRYQPGVAQKVTVTVTDPNATFWGYEMTSVKTSNPAVGKGNFKAIDNLSDVRKLDTKSYAAHINDQAGKTGTVKFVVKWKPPLNNVGKITLYVAGIGGTGNPDFDSVYTSKLTLSPQ